MTFASASALKGGRGTRKVDESIDKLCERDSDKGGRGSKKSNNFANVINERLLTINLRQ